MLFVILGPLIGCFTFWESGMFEHALNLDDYSAMSPEGIASIKNETISVKLFSILIVGPFMGIVGYPLSLMIGAIPASATALSYWATLKFGTKKNLTRFNRCLIGGILGVVVSTVYGVVIHPFGMGVLHIFTIPGVVSSAICAIFVGNGWYSIAFPDRSDETENMSISK